MPKGVIIWEWNERSGAEIISRFPSQVEIDEKTLMQIYSAHEREEKSGIITLMVGPMHILSYYTGEESGYYIGLLLGLDEEGEIYEDAIINAGRVILMSIEQGTLDIILSGIFGRIANYPKLEIQQLYAILYQTDVKRAILNRLEKDGYISKGELNIWLSEKFDFTYIDLESELMSLVKHGLVKQGTVKGFPSEVLYLMNVLFITRIPPVDIIKDGLQRGMPKHLMDKYLDEVREFFTKYVPSEKDNIEICEIIGDLASYEVIKLLRMSVVTKETLEKLKKKGVEDVDATLERLIKANVVIKLPDEKKRLEYYALKSDVLVKRVFPEFLINLARKAHNERTKSSKVLIEHMKLLKEAYLESLKTEKVKETG
ncbi:MAG: hypothetical protein ACTSWN_10160 [Promethearchaeota archaeon]